MFLSLTKNILGTFCQVPKQNLLTPLHGLDQKNTCYTSQALMPTSGVLLITSRKESLTTTKLSYQVGNDL